MDAVSVSASFQRCNKHGGILIETRPDGTVGQGLYAFLDDTHDQVQPASKLMGFGIATMH